MGRVEKLADLTRKTKSGSQDGVFRHDINGLRAWAVISVVMYHFGVGGFSGGFVGVDVFFVISGFLMTGVIYKYLEKPGNGWFGSRLVLVDFFLSRIGRIAPALVVLCLALAVVGWFFLFPSEYASLGKGIVSAVGFFSNIQFNREFGYFDSASEENLLLHTWSLSVEWQFYVVLPFFILLMWRVSSNKNFHAVVFFVCAALSFALSVWASTNKPMFAFYMLPSRAWEMLAGGVLFLVSRNFILSGVTGKIAELSGFALIIYSIVMFDESIKWPGCAALLPVTGALLVLLSAQQKSFWSGNVIAQTLGSWSYSIYLWHWPLAVGLVYIQAKEVWLYVGACLLLTILLGWASYVFVEGPGRSVFRESSRRKSISKAVVCYVFVSVVGIGAINADVIYGGRLPVKATDDFAGIKDVNPRRVECQIYGSRAHPECTYGGDTLGVIVIGDSHAGALVRAVEKVLPDKSLSVLDWTYEACPTILGIKHVSDKNYECGKNLNIFLGKSHTLPSSVPIIIINRLALYVFGYNESVAAKYRPPFVYLTRPYVERNADYLSELREGAISTACEFAKDRPVYMVRPIPELMRDVPKSMARGVLLGIDGSVSITLDEYRQRQKFVVETQDLAAARCGIKILDPIPYLCPTGECRGDFAGKPIYFDDDHLSLRGADLLAPMFRKVFEGR